MFNPNAPQFDEHYDHKANKSLILNHNHRILRKQLYCHMSRLNAIAKKMQPVINSMNNSENSVLSSSSSLPAAVLRS